MLLILLSLLTFLHRLEDVPGLCPTTQLVKPQNREPRFLSPSRKRVDHCPISISPPRGPVLLQPRARRPEEAGRPEATLQPEAPSELRGRGGGGREEASARSVRPARSPPAARAPPGVAFSRSLAGPAVLPAAPVRPSKPSRPPFPGPLTRATGPSDPPQKKKDPISQHYWISNVGCDGGRREIQNCKNNTAFSYANRKRKPPTWAPLDLDLATQGHLWTWLRVAERGGSPVTQILALATQPWGQARVPDPLPQFPHL